MFMQMALQKVGVDLCKKLLDCYVTVIMRHHCILQKNVTWNTVSEGYAEHAEQTQENVCAMKVNIN